MGIKNQCLYSYKSVAKDLPRVNPHFHVMSFSMCASGWCTRSFRRGRGKEREREGEEREGGRDRERERERRNKEKERRKGRRKGGKNDNKNYFTSNDPHHGISRNISDIFYIFRQFI